MRSLVTGIAGQDGYYLAKHLLERGDEVRGLARRSSTSEARIVGLCRELPGLKIEYGDITDSGSVADLVQRFRPDRVFNLAAISFVPASWENPAQVVEVNAKGLINVLAAVRSFAPEARVAQASTSEMYGDVDHGRMLSEDSPMHPRSVYGAAKLFAHNACDIYRESYGMYISSLISFNHESPRRPEHFVTRKVTSWAARVAGGSTERLALGNLDAYRDWGFAGDYMRGMMLALEAPEPADYVLATGEMHSIKELVAAACRTAGIDFLKEFGPLVSDPTLVRPHDVNRLCGDPDRAKRVLGWEPEVGFDDLIAMMVHADKKQVLARYN